MWDAIFNRLPDWAEPVVDYIIHVGLRNTLIISAVSVVLAVVIGVLLGTLLTIKFLPLQAAIRLYIEVWRGLPIIVTIFLLYFALPTLSDEAQIPALNLDPLRATILGLALWGSAQIAEATRGAVQSIPKEQHEASAALGFGWVGRHVNVILPQALRRLIPPLVGLSVGVIQNSTLGSIIGVPEVLETANRSANRLAVPTVDPATLTIEGGDSHALEIYLFVFAIFFVISFPLTRLAAYLERRLV
ncbi:MAG TPA: amino acid ABC transporter permease [Gaiellaceae bacterium]|jgi:polar amino acid transport system permease protein|nr:amino acid ABC transporter permease [Gaiellaceae bacterium]